MHRSLLLFAALLACPGASAASACDGRYAQAALMVDSAWSKAGTLYSGGNHFSHLDHVGATVDLYRLWRGLPDLGLRRMYGYESIDTRLQAENVPGLLDEGLRLMSAAEPAASEHERFASLVHLDLLTPVSPQPDWWEHPLDEARTPIRAAVARVAQQSEALEWLLLVAAASDARWMLDPDSRASDAGRETSFAELSQRAQERHAAGAGLEWLAAAATLAPPGSAADRALQDERETLAAAVLACRASPAEFAAWAVLVASSDALTSEREVFVRLPAGLARRHFEWHLRFAAGPGFRTGEYPALAAAFGLPDDVIASAVLADVYFAADLHAVEAAHRRTPWHPGSARALNLLSAEQLQRLSTSANFTPAQRAVLAGTAYARHFALGRIDAAESLVPALRDGWPAVAGEIDALHDLELPAPVRLALIALALPRVATWLQPEMQERPVAGDFALHVRHARFRRELPPDMADGAFLQGDYETWRRLPNRWYRYSGMRGMQFYELQRFLMRHREWRPSRNAASDLRTPPLPLQQWMSREELRRLGDGGALTLALARALLACAEDPPFAWTGSDCRGTAMATGLRRLIDLARREDEPLLDGEPVGRRAFRVLQREMPDTPAARDTRYWHR